MSGDNIVLVGYWRGVSKMRRKSVFRTIFIAICASIVLIPILACIIVIIVHHGFPVGNQTHSGMWHNARLSSHLKPSLYDIRLRSDFVNFIFDGVVSIDVDCHEKTNVVVLHCSELTVTDVAVSSSDAPHPTWESNPALDGNPWFQEENQFLVFKLKSALAKGRNYTIHVKFSGPLQQDYVGYYTTPYETSSGTRWIGSTQFSEVYARQVFPCFDEPAFKARFLLTLDHAPDYKAIANMPLISNSTLEDGWTRSKFEESVPMSTYLMAWTVFDFDFKEKTTSDGVLFRVWAREDAINAVDYALEKGADVLDFYGEYFGTKFPLPKMDFVAVPGFQTIAMENWGMNTFEQSKLLYEDNVTTSYDKMTICAWIAHELAHQWFGNLVTLTWWDDLWLNEGFASYVEYLGTNYTEPEWNMMDLFMWRHKYPVLVTDSLLTSRPISVPVITNKDISQQFDLISYNKGASILRMLSNFLGETTFRNGLKFYLETYAYNNTGKDDLWAKLSEAAIEDGKSNMDVKKIMDTWTIQMGYPLVTITRDYDREDGIHFTATQERFLLNPDNPDAKKQEYQWHIPLKYTTSFHPQFENPSQEWITPSTVPRHTSFLVGVPSFLMPNTVTPSTKPEEISINDTRNSDWLLANVESRGYYRVNYDLSNWALLTDTLMKNHDAIPPGSRSTLINDAFNLARAGYLDIGVALNISRYLSSEWDFVPWAAADDVMGFVESMLRGTEAHNHFKQYMLNLVTPLYSHIGWNTPNAFLDRHLQALTMKMACAYGHVDCINQSISQYSQWKNNPETNRISPDVRIAVYCTAIEHGDSEDWNFAFDQYNTTNSDTEKVTLLSAMSCTKDPNILDRYLTYLLSIDVISDADHASVLSGVLANEVGTELAWNFFWQHFDDILRIHSENVFSVKTMATSLTATLNSNKQLSQLKSKLRENSNQEAAQRTFTQGVEITETNIRWMQKNYDTVETWLKQHNL
ncbi:aminopeptidase N-like [Amphiura filiformis]|uniref:aminopeptidase N-like n=1 Tax=Amphiura filiformis TaxID=82378 RepID=UPI003B21D74F